MHKLNVLVLGSSSFISTLNELKAFLKFNPILKNSDKNYEVILFHHEVLTDEEQSAFINKSDSIKIYVGRKSQTQIKYDAILELPTSLKEINNIIENVAAKKKYSKNSSIKVKEYVLNKNEKKLLKLDEFIILTEKEVQLIELFLNNKKPISKDNILTYVWNYSSDADTHTVETHIYRLRKKISDKFMDEKFILNNKDGYYLCKKETR
jgi:DNA-binding winged helix-turn-helix (wHTH) protein